MTTLTKLKHLSRDLITSSYSTLTKVSTKYAEYAKKDHGIANALIPGLRRANNSNSNYQGYKSVVQALFESGFISTKDSDFNTEQLFNYIYGVKCVHAIPSFMKLHAWLINNDHTDHVGTLAPSDLYVTKGKLRCFDCDETFPLSKNKEEGCTNCNTTTNQKTWNPSGDNYFSAYQFEHKLSDTEQSVIGSRKGDDEVHVAAFDRVVIVENQSPMWAYILTDSPFTGKPDKLYIVRLKCNYKDKNRLPELLELVKNNQLENNSKWSGHNGTSRHGIVAYVNIKEMECKQVLQPKHIESALFNIYSGSESL